MFNNEFIDLRSLGFMVVLLFLSAENFAQDAVIESLGNTACQGVPCGVVGSKVLINEFMVSPSINDGSLTGDGPGGGRGEWLELYNPDACNPVDISCYTIGNYTVEGSGAIRIPQNTIIPPSGFALIRGTEAPTVPPANLVANGGNTIEVTLPFEINVPEVCLVGGPAAIRVWFPNSGGWFGVYDENGEPQDAVRWGTANASSLNIAPCLPEVTGCSNATTLLSFNDIPPNRKSIASTYNGFVHVGQSIRRATDGGVWNAFGPPTAGVCNGPCYTVGQTICTGMATVISAPGIGPYIYSWDDPLNQTLQTAIGLCPGTYTCTVTSFDGIISAGVVTIGLYSPPVNIDDQIFCVTEPSQAILVDPPTNFFPTANITGPGVSSGMFNPSTIGVGNHTISYNVIDQSGCTGSDDALFIVHPVPGVSMNLPTWRCITALPFVVNVSPAGGVLSGPGIVGDTFNPALAGPGVHQVSYTYTDPNGCTNPATITVQSNITVQALTTSTFDFDDEYCQGSTIPSLPTTSIQGILGAWQPAINNQQTTVYTFTPSANQCAASANETITINQATLPTFPNIPSYCFDAVIPPLPPISNNGIQGSWSPAISNQQTTTYTFTPAPLECAVSTTLDIVINPILTPNFDTPEVYCSGVAIPNLPTTSLNGVPGSWSPAINNSQTTTYTFTPAAGACAVSSSLEIQVVSGSVSLACPADFSISCYADLPASYMDFNEFQNQGGSLSSVLPLLVNSSLELSNESGTGLSCNTQVLRTYTFSNVCGQTASCVQTIAVDDDIPPTGEAPNDTLVECINQIPPPDVNLVFNVSDNCSVPTVSFLSDTPTGTCPQIVTRIYRVTDACGNIADLEQIITVWDTTAPTGIAPADVFVLCPNDVPAPNISSVSNVIDNCVTPTVSFVGDVSSGSCPTLITRTYAINDVCGNTTELDQIITVWDTIAPTGVAPPNLTVECMSEVPTPNPASVIAPSDNCGFPSIIHLSDISVGSCPKTITRTYRLEDNCGNETDLVQTITVFDLTPPTANAPQNISVSCLGNVPAPNINSVTNLSDNCGIPSVVHLSDLNDNNLCNNQTITRFYAITDGCGNQVTVSQQILIDVVTPTASISFTNPTTCGGTDGTISLIGLLPNENYILSYTGNSISFTSDANGEYTITGLSQGTFSNIWLYFQDCNTCVQVLQNIVLNDPPPPPIDAGPDQTVCVGQEIVLNAVNPLNLPLTWSGGVQNGVFFIPPTGTNTFTVSVSQNNCIATDEVVVAVNFLPDVTAGNDTMICANIPFVLQGQGAATYIWNNGVVDGIPFIQEDQFAIYQVTGIDTNGCFSQDEIQIGLIENPFPSFTPSVQSGCELPFIAHFDNTSSLPVLSCDWTFEGAGGLQFWCDDVIGVFNSVGCFDVSLEVTYGNGCQNTTTEDDAVCIFPKPEAKFYATPETVDVGKELYLTNVSQNATSYIWDFGVGEQFTDDVDAIFVYDTVGVFDINLIAINDFGCTDTAKQVVQIRNPALFYVPNSFTPDGDNFNSEFKPIMTAGFNPFEYELTIMSRTGQILFISKNADFGWPGTFGSEIVPSGMYTWIIKFRNGENLLEFHTGHVNLLR